MKYVVRFKSPIRPLANFMIVIVTLSIGGCSAIPDALNPVEWYKGARDAITDTMQGDKGIGVQELDKNSKAKDNNSFPSLSSVPSRPQSLNSNKGKNIKEGLIGDNNAARKYSNEIIKRQEENPKSSKISNPGAESKKFPAINRSVSNAPPKIKPLTSTTSEERKPGLVYISPPKPIQTTGQKKAVIKQNKKNAIKRAAIRSVPSKMKRLPAYNPNPPKIASIPNLNSYSGQGKTIVVSGSGIHNFGGLSGLSQKLYQSPPRRMGISQMKSIGQTASNNGQGSYKIATILFGNGSSRISAHDRRVLRKVVAQHKKIGGVLRIVGHASSRTRTNDPILHKMTNFQISASRAERVAKEFVKLGMKTSKLFVASVSDSQPRYYEYMPAGEAGNRRTEIYIDF